MFIFPLITIICIAILTHNCMVAITKQAYFKQKLKNRITIMRIRGEKEGADKLDQEIAEMDKKKYFWQL